MGVRTWCVATAIGAAGALGCGSDAASGVATATSGDAAEVAEVTDSDVAEVGAEVAIADGAVPETADDDTTTDSAVSETGAETVADSAVSETVTETVGDSVAAETTADSTAPETTADSTTTEVTPQVPDPSAPGPLNYTTTVVQIAGFDVDLYIPEGGGPFPLVFLSPGFQLKGSNFKGFGEHLASHGFLAAIPTWGDPVWAPITHANLAKDVSAILDELVKRPDVDATRIGAGGHSRGGKIAILAATQDARIRASFNLDPVDSVGPFSQPDADNPSVTPELMGSFTIPGAFLGTGKGDDAGLGGACAPPAENYQQYFDHAASAVKYSWVLPAAGHNDFAENLGVLALACPAGDDPAATRQVAKRKLIAFYQMTLVGDARYAAWLDP